MNKCELTFNVEWADMDDEWVATCDKYPLLRCLSISPIAALAELWEELDIIEGENQWTGY